MPAEEPTRDPGPQVYRFGDCVLDLRTHRLSAGGRPLAVEPRVFDALVHLVENRERLITKDELFEGVWPDEAVSDNALSRTIARLRLVLGDDTRRPRYIETVHGRGYRFVAAVKVVRERPASSAGTARRRWRPSRRLTRATVLAVLAAAAVTGWWALSRSEERDTAAGAHVEGLSSPLDPLRVAVLPMRDLGAEEQSRLFADGLTEQMISVLSQIEGLRVISASTTMTYRGTGQRPSEIARDLGAGTLLAGSVRRAEEELRVTVELIDATDEELIWSRQFDTRPEDIFAVQSEVAIQIADALQVSLPISAVRRIREGPTREMSAFEHYLRGRQAYRQTTRSGNETAIQHYRRALEVDPGFALAHAGLANAHAVRAVRFGFGDEERRLAETFARTALSADPRLPEAHKALGIVAYNRGRLRLALEHHEKAIELNPSYDEAIYNAASTSALLGAWDKGLSYQLRATNWVQGRAALAAYLLRLGFLAEGERLADRVLEEEPLARYLNLNLAEHELFAGRVAAARERIAKIIAAEPSWPRAHRLAGDLELWQGRLETARGHYLRALEADSEGYPEATLRLAQIDLSTGHTARGEDRLAALAESLAATVEPDSEYWGDYWLLGSLAAARADADAAIAWRDRAIAAGWREHWRDASDPGLATLRDDTRFQAQLRRMRRLVDSMRERVRPAVEAVLPRMLGVRG